MAPNPCTIQGSTVVVCLMACELPEAGTVPCVCAAHRPPPPRGSISRGCSAEGREVTEGLTTLGTVDAGVVFSAPQGKEALVENQPPDSCRPDGWASRGVLNAFLLLVKNTDSAPPHASHFLSVREGSVQEGERLFSQHGGGKREVTAAEVSDPNEDCGHLQASVTDEAAKEEPGSGCQHVRLQGAVAHPPPPTGRPLPLGMGMARNRTELLAICLPLWASKAPHLRNEECWFGQCCLNHPILTNQ